MNVGSHGEGLVRSASGVPDGAHVHPILVWVAQASREARTARTMKPARAAHEGGAAGLEA
jgi:hypothetical protein